MQQFFPNFLYVYLFFIYIIIKRLNIYFYFKLHLEKGKESISYFINIFQNYKSYKRGKEVKKIVMLEIQTFLQKYLQITDMVSDYW